MIAFWLVGNWLLFMIGSYVIMICEMFGLFQQKTAKKKLPATEYGGFA